MRDGAFERPNRFAAPIMIRTTSGYLSGVETFRLKAPPLEGGDVTLALGALLLAGTVSAAPCENVAALRLVNTTMTSAQIVAAGAFTLPADSPASDPSFFTAFATLRAFCRVQGVIHP